MRGQGIGWVNVPKPFPHSVDAFFDRVSQAPVVGRLTTHLGFCRAPDKKLLLYLLPVFGSYMRGIESTASLVPARHTFRATYLNVIRQNPKTLDGTYKMLYRFAINPIHNIGRSLSNLGFEGRRTISTL